MSNFCAVIGCKSREEIEYFKIPKDLTKSKITLFNTLEKQKLSQVRQKLWLYAINRKELYEHEDRLEDFINNAKICSRHFYSGNAASLGDINSDDWVPTLDMGYKDSSDKLWKMMESTLRNLRQESSLINIEQENSSVSNPDSIYKCGFCLAVFFDIKDINEHIQSVHNDWSDSELEEEVKNLNSQSNQVTVSNQSYIEREKLDMLMEDLENFEWCECERCVSICNLFIQHVKEEHKRKNVTTEHSYTAAAAAATGVDDNDDFEWPLTEPEESVYDCDGNKIQFNKFNAKPTIVEPRITNGPDILLKTAPKKKVLFKIQRRGGIKSYMCTVCKGVLDNHANMLEHSKLHFSNRQKMGEIFSSIDDNMPIQETILGKDLNVLEKVIDYQCSVCENVLTSREKAMKCMQKHLDNGWPRDLNAKLLWDSLTKLGGDTTTMETMDQMTASDGFNPFSYEECLEKIALEYRQVTDPPDVPHDHERTYYRCQYCHNYYDDLNEMEKHFTDTHSNIDFDGADHSVKIESLIFCKFCKTDNDEILSFRNTKDAIIHRHQCHVKSYARSSENKVKRYVINPDGSEVVVDGNIQYNTYHQECISEEYKCPCEKVYRFRSLAFRCLSKHVGIRRFKCDKNHPITALKCGIQFYTLNELLRHQKRVHQPGNRKVKAVCHLCGDEFFGNILKKHMMIKHSTDNSNVRTCPTCGKDYPSDYRLKLHIQAVHEKVAKHRCDICFKRFTWKSAADRCQAQHTNKRDYKCEYCPKTFYTITQKVSHRAITHAKMNNFSCGWCTYKAKSVKQLSKHCTLKHKYTEEEEVDLD